MNYEASHLMSTVEYLASRAVALGDEVLCREVVLALGHGLVCRRDGEAKLFTLAVRFLLGQDARVVVVDVLRLRAEYLDPVQTVALLHFFDDLLSVARLLVNLHYRIQPPIRHVQPLWKKNI